MDFTSRYCTISYRNVFGGSFTPEASRCFEQDPQFMEIVSSARTLVLGGARFAHNVLSWKWPSGKSFPCIKLSKSMALAMDGAFVFYFCCSGARLPNCLLDSGENTTWRHVTSDLTQSKMSIISIRCLLLSKFIQTSVITHPVKLWNTICILNSFPNVAGGLHSSQQVCCSLIA